MEKTPRPRAIRGVPEKKFAIAAELAPDQFFHPNAFPDPKRYRHQKTFQAGRRIREITMQNPVEFQERLFVERHILELLHVDAAFAEAIHHCVLRKTRIMLFARESFLLRRCYDFSVAHQACRAVMIKSGETEDIHKRRLVRKNLRQPASGADLTHERSNQSMRAADRCRSRTWRITRGPRR